MRLFSNMLTFNRVRDGEDGKQGPMPVNTGQWNKDVEYIKDEFIQPYVWQIKNGKKLYYLLVAERSLGDDPYTNNTQGNGDIWRYREEYDLFLARKIQADDIDVDNLVVRKVKTANSGPRFEMEGSEMKVYGDGVHPNMIFGVNKDGYAVMEYYTPAGDKLYDLGPSGISMLEFAPAKWTEFRLLKFGDDIPKSELDRMNFIQIERNTTLARNAPIFKTYYAGGSPLITPAEREKEKFTYKDNNWHIIDDGWYFDPPVANSKDYPTILSQNTGRRIKPGGDNALYQYSDGVTDRDTIYYTRVYRYKGGIRIERTAYYWQNEM